MTPGEKVATSPLKVLVTTEDYEIRGLMHTRPGGYQSRISDLLNLKDLHYIPITQATYRSLRHPDEPPRKAWTLIVRLDTIRMVVPEDEADSRIVDPTATMQTQAQSGPSVPGQNRPLQATG